MLFACFIIHALLFVSLCYCVLINLTNADSHSFVFINNSEKINHMNYSQFIVLDFNSNYLFII